MPPPVISSPTVIAWSPPQPLHRNPPTVLITAQDPETGLITAQDLQSGPITVWMGITDCSAA
jgi:hypothetical protein